jgi:hypothetical protein
MKLLSMLVIVLTLLAAVSCDRFEHTFAPAVETDFQNVLFTPLADSFQTVTATDLQSVMSFYAEDYLHNGQYKSDREGWFQNMLEQHPGCFFNIDLLSQRQDNDSLAAVNWRLTITDNFKSLLADSTFIDEQLIKRNGTWLLYGNRDDCGCNPAVNQTVLLEYFTFQTCPNCPIVEELLHNLYNSFAGRMTYLEYHLNDPMAIPPNYGVFQYYGLTNMPVTVFQGETVIYGNNDDNETVYTQLIQNLSSQPARIGLEQLHYTMPGDTLNGTIHLEIKDPGITQDNLKLKYVLMEKVSDVYVNAAQVPCMNVVLAAGTQSLAGVDLQQDVSFSLVYANPLPSDAYLVIWTQELLADFNNASTVYHALESHVVPSKRK